MRLGDIIILAKEYLLTGIVAALAVSLILVFLYKKTNKTDKGPEWRKIAWVAAMICYIIFLFGAVFMSRSTGVWTNRNFLPAFYSYKDAWINFSAAAWRNIVLNICLFIPLGFLIPIGFRKMRRLWKTAAAGFGVSLLIEFTQIIFRKGIGEVDDLIDNTVGTMIGFGVFVLVLLIFNWIRGRKTEEFTWKKMFLYQIPFILTLLTFTIIFTSYAKQELGNLAISPVIVNDRDMFQIEGRSDFPKEAEQLPVYRSRTFTQEEAVEYGNEILRNFGSDIDEKLNDYYEDTVFLKAPERFHININYHGGSYSLVDFDTSYGSDKQKVKTDVTEQEARERLLEFGIEIPTEAEYIIDNSTGDFIFKVSMLKENHCVLDGSLRGKLYENGYFGYIDNFIVRYDEYRQFYAISPARAYEKLLDGKFEQLPEFSKINIKDYEIRYMSDSKGFYQPCYAFTGTINGEESAIMIPALEK